MENEGVAMFVNTVPRFVYPPLKHLFHQHKYISTDLKVILVSGLEKVSSSAQEEPH